MTSATNPKVSVVIPCLNRAHFLAPTIDSVLEQSYGNVECVVIDGGSTDDSVDLLRRYGDRITWVSEPDNGQVYAMDKGWAMCTGEILGWLNADDVYVLPDAVGQAVRFLEERPDVDVVYGDIAGIDSKGDLVGDVVRPRPWDLEYAVKYCHPMIHSPASFIRRRALDKVNWLDTDCYLCCDQDLFLRIGLEGKLEYTPVLFAHQRQGNGLSQQRDQSKYKVWLTKKFFSNPNLPKPFNKLRFRRRAMSNAHLMGGYHAWLAGHRDLFFLSLLKSLRTDPLNVPNILGKALKVTLLASLIKRLPKTFKNQVGGPFRQWLRD